MIAQDTAAWPIPSSLNNEHSRLHIELEAAAKAPGRIGVAARAVAAALHPHFVREEAIALPPLALLGALARGELTPDMRAILPLTDALERELPTMLEEHQAIHRTLDELARASREAGVAEYAELSDKIRLHALSEEQILYPAAILVGKYMKCRLG